MSMIRDQKAFDIEGRFYKGNLHCHTTQSDGAATPAQRVEEYRAAGYDFLALTDHNCYSAFTEYTDDTFLLIPGVELDCGPNGTESLGYHTVGIALPGKNTIPAGKVVSGRTVAEQIAYLNAHGNMAIVAHPYWLQMDMEAFIDLENVAGFEVYNTVCHAAFGTGFSESYYDYAIKNGRYPLAFASDDYHAGFGRTEPDHFLGYIMVKAPALTHEAIVNSILAGNFYATYGGPEIHDFEIRDGKAIVTTSPCRQICLRSPKTVGSAVNSYTDNLTRAEFPLSGHEKVIRAVVIDKEGHTSWTQVLPVIRD